MSFLGTAVLGAGVIGGISTIYSANKAAEAQTTAAQKAQDTALGMYNTTRGDLSPYRAIGEAATTQMTANLPDWVKPISVNPDDFKNSDMYKFAQDQGERAVTNSSAARGLGTSGAALKGAAAFESGLNLQNWQQNFNNQVTNQTNGYNRLKALIDTGNNAAAQTGSAGTSAASTAAGAQLGAGNAQAAATNASGAAIGGIANSAGIGGYLAYRGNGLYGGDTNSFGGSSEPTYGPVSVGGAPLN